MGATAYDFWLFDFDGTVVDVEWQYQREVCTEVGARLGCAFSDREVAVLWYGLDRERRALLAERGVDLDRFWSAFHDVEDPAARADATYLYDDATVVGDLDGATGLVTHCHPSLTNPVLDRLDVRDWFDTVVCCSDETGWKPDPAPVELAMADLGVEGDGAMAGDAPTDVGAAWNAGLDAVHVERIDPHDRGHCVLGDHRIESLRRLPRGPRAATGD